MADASRVSNGVRDTVLAMGLAAVPLMLHLLTNTQYGYFRDEFYYIACSAHLDFGYVDHPPLSILMLAVERWLLGDSLSAIRFLPAVAGALLVLLTAAITRALGGGRFAQGLAALAVVVAPFYLAVGNFFSMNVLEPLFWMMAAYLLVRIVNTGNSRLWLAFGVVAGLGLENKHSMLLFGCGVLVALLLTPQRKYLRDGWLWLGAVTAALLFLPNILWEAGLGWPTLEFMHNAQTYKIAPMSPVELLVQQILMLQPLTLPLWLAGIWYYLFSRHGQRYRLCGWIYVVVLAVCILQRTKAYYLAPIYPLLLAAGAIVFERLTQRSDRGWLRPACISALAIGGIITAPLALPVLPADTLVRYARFLHLGESAKGATSETAKLGELPQYFADMFGWEDVVEAVARAYESLPVEERRKAAIYVGNYGEAGAIDVLGKARHLPPAISGHNNYWLWGPGDYSGEVVIVLGGPSQDLESLFEKVERVGTVRCGYCMPFENDRSVYVCRGLKRPLKEIWPQLKHYV
ncbi:MAG TPA: glycosyltransferase family 39 protein [Candidatus Binatia bacterium]